MCFKTLVVKCRKRKISFSWKHRIFQQKRKLHGGEVKGHFSGNKVDAINFPANERACVCMCVCVCVKREECAKTTP